MDIAHLKSVNKTIGAKQTLKQIAKGAVKYVFLGCDSDERVVQPLRIACEEQEIPVNDNTPWMISVVRVALRCGPQL